MVILSWVKAIGQIRLDAGYCLSKVRRWRREVNNFSRTDQNDSPMNPVLSPQRHSCPTAGRRFTPHSQFTSLQYIRVVSDLPWERVEACRPADTMRSPHRRSRRVHRTPLSHQSRGIRRKSGRGHFQHSTGPRLDHSTIFTYLALSFIASTPLSLLARPELDNALRHPPEHPIS